MPAMKNLNNESGAALIFAILMLALLSIIGISATTNTDFELKIAGNEKAQKMAFYAVEAGNELSKEMIGQIVEARGWKNEIGPTKTIDQVTIQNKDFWLNEDLGSTPPSSANSDMSFPFGNGTNYARFGANGMLSTGGAIQMAAGYEGMGKGAAGGGAWIIYDVRTRHEGANNSRAQVKGQWRHVL